MKINKILKKITYPFKRFFWKIRNVFRWLPVIWNQYDFDHSYAINVFKFQLLKIADFMESDKAMTLDAAKRAKRIRTAVKLMDMVYDGEYGTAYIDKIEKIYGKRKFVFIPCEDRPDCSTLEYEYEVEYTKDELEIIHEHEHELFVKANEKQKKAHRILWAFIEHNIQGWWD